MFYLLSNKYEIDLTTGSMVKKMIMFAIPLMLTGCLQLLYNAADIVIVGRYAGTQALSAVGSTGALINLMINVLMGLSTGASVVISRFYGASDEKNLSETIHTAISVALIGGFCATVFGATGAKYLLQLTNTPEDVIGLSTLYISIMFLGMPFNMLYNFGAAILRASGDTRRPLVYLSFSGLINVILNYILVVFFSMSVAGVAIATITSQLISSCLVIRALLKSETMVKLYIKKIKIHKDKLFLLLKVGLPAGIQGSLFSMSNLIIQSSINTFGSVIMAGNAAAGNLEGFVYTCTNAFHQTNVTFSSQNIGAGQYARVRKSLWICLGIGCTVAFSLSMFLVFNSGFLISIYDNNPLVIEAGSRRLLLQTSLYFIFAAMDITVGQLRGIGYSFTPMLISLCGICALRVLWVQIVFNHFKTIEVLYYSYPISWTLTFTAQLILYLIVSRKLPKHNIERNLQTQ